MEYNAAEMIIAAHHHFREVFSQYDMTNSLDERRVLVESVIPELVSHAQSVEAVFLPAVEKAVQRKDLISEAQKDNSALYALVDKMKSLEPGSEHFDPTFRLIEESMLAHIEVEEQLILPLAKQIGLDMDDLGDKMKQKGSPVDKGDERLAGFGD